MYHVYPLVTENPRYGKLDGAIIDIESGDHRSIKIQTWDPHVRYESVGKQK